MTGTKTLTKTLVVLTVPGVGKTWYKKFIEDKIEDYNKMVQKDGAAINSFLEKNFKYDEFVGTLIFDMGEYDDKPIKEKELTFLNLIYITRKLHLNSIIMINGYKLLMGLLYTNDIPYITLIPKNRYKYCKNDMNAFENVMYMDHNSTFKYFFDNDIQYLSDKISGMWNKTAITEELWFAYDRRYKII